MRRLFHLLFGWDFIYIPNWGICRLRVNQDGVLYVKIKAALIRISVSDFKCRKAFFVYGSILDYFSPNEIEDIHGTTHSQ